MIERSPRRWTGRGLAVATVVVAASLGVVPALVASPAAAAPRSGQAYLIHGIIGETLDIYVDGDRVRGSVKPKSVIGPLTLDAGTHDVQLRDGSDTVAESKVRIGSGQSVDVVAHLLSDASQGATVTAFTNNLSAVGPGKLRLAVAHTAAAPPADIRVDGDVLFNNVASGETLTVVVPAKTYTVDVVPSANDGEAILGPVDLPLKQGTLTRVFAVGNVTTGSMDAVVHTLPISTSGSGAPGSVPSGDGGQAAQQLADQVAAPLPDGRARVAMLGLTSVALVLAAAAGLVARSGRRTGGRRGASARA